MDTSKLIGMDFATKTLILIITIHLIIYPSKVTRIGGGHPTNMLACVVIINVV
jgi:hypothetical protein